MKKWDWKWILGAPDTFDIVSTKREGVKPRDIVPRDKGDDLIKVQTGFEWMEWSHGGKGVPWRINTKEFNALLMDGWEIVDICNSFTLLKRPTFVHYSDSSTKPRPRRKKK